MQRFTTVVAALFLSCGLTAPAFPATITISENTGADYSGVAETGLAQVSPTSNSSGGNPLEISKYAPGDYRHGLIKTTLPAILIGKTINSAKLKLKISSDSNLNTFAISARTVVRAAVITEATWNSYSTGNAWGTAGGTNNTTDRVATPVGASSADPTVGTYLDLTGLASAIAAAAAGGSITLHLERSDGADDGNYVGFYSSEGSDGNRPEWEIDYSDAVAPPYADTFTRSDDAVKWGLSSDTQFTWQPTSATGQSIVSNQGRLTPPSVSTHGFANAQAQVATDTMFAEVDIVAVNIAGSAFSFAMVICHPDDESSGYYVSYDGTTLYLGGITAGGLASTAIASPVGKRLKLVYRDSDDFLGAYLDDVLALSVTTSAEASGSGKRGASLSLIDDSTSSYVTFDNFDYDDYTPPASSPLLMIMQQAKLTELDKQIEQAGMVAAMGAVAVKGINNRRHFLMAAGAAALTGVVK